MAESSGTGLDWIQRQQQEQAARRPPPRYAGVLAHPTSLPGPHGIGDLGSGTFAFLDWLAAAGQSRWQILPLGPTGYGDSPYQSFSAFAGNPLLISLEGLAADGLLDAADLAHNGFADERVDFGAVIPFKLERLQRAAARFHAGAGRLPRAEYARFLDEHAGWLDDYALFMALKAACGGGSWTGWPAPERLRHKRALAAARARLADEIDAQRFIQFAFFQQWAAVRARANALGIQVIGDIPIFVALDSADVWANAREFQLDRDARPTAVAGVPPDYFSATGQLWGNPLYHWRRMANTGYAWWIARFRAVYTLVDIARIDHFRGFEAYWSIPAGERTAVNGRWVKGPGRAVFDAVRAALVAPARDAEPALSAGREPALRGAQGPHVPVIAEDLGVITPAVDALRTGLGYPGMAVLQFAFGSGSDNLYLPHNHTRDTVVYPGTHDNDTTTGWYAAQDEVVRHHARAYLASHGDHIAWDLLRAAWLSVAETAIVPLQDILGLGTEARMNLPGRPGGNWTWRLRPGTLTARHAARLKALTEIAGRARVASDEG